MISIVLLLVFSLAEGHPVDVNITKDGVSSNLIFLLLIFLNLVNPNFDFNFFHSEERKDVLFWRHVSFVRSRIILGQIH